ncbi:MAG: hypothetical protein HZA49_07925 [Planctomycetes bacterium]|nr:hypothetical protein [Planctomycetota bacterium]
MKKLILPLVLLAGWILPGFAHWFYGKRYKALVFFGIVLTCSAIGVIIADFRFVRFADNPFYYVGQFGSGLTLMLKTLLTSEAPRGIVSMSYFEVGLLYICVGGILNLVILLNLCSQLLARKPAATKEPTATEQPATTQINPTNYA